MKNFVVYKSSAGSGKTFTLVKEYLRLSLHNPSRLQSNFRKILAVTFTNKAAAEMKTRVVDALHKLSQGELDSAIATILKEQLQVSGEELQRRAGLVLRSILHNYSDFSIGTIDSFTHRIVRTFAHDLDLPVNFNIELDTAAFYEKVVSLLFNKVGEDEYVSRLLKDFALGKAGDNVSWDPEQQLLDFTNLLQKENAEYFIEKLSKFSAEDLENFRRQFQDFIDHYRGELKKYGENGMQLIRQAQVQESDFVYKSSGPQSIFTKAAAGIIEPSNVQLQRVQDAIEKKKWFSDAGMNNSPLADQLSATASEVRGFVLQNHPYFLLCQTLAKQMYPLMLLKKLEEISREQKAEDRLVFISEFNQRIYDIIQNEPAPFIYERLGERYQHYLIDEFQDTSSLQWQNMLPLVDNSLANGWYNLVVGDGKQSIYRWRNANVKQFAGLPKIDASSFSAVQQERSGSLERNYQEEPLNDNYRSGKNIIEFNNQLFRFLSGKVLHQDQSVIYHRLEQNSKSSFEGLVTIDAGSVAPDELDQLTFSVIESRLEEAQADGFEYRDICILCRTNLHGNVIASELVGKGVPVVSSDSLLLRNNQEVNTLVCFLNYLVNPSDLISAAAVLNYLFQKNRMDAEMLHELTLALTKKQSLFRVLEKAGISGAQEQVRAGNLFDTCASIADILQLNIHAYRYIRFFLDEVNEYMVSRNAGISEFLDWWEVRKKSSSLKIPDSINAVRIMTIHASKGLEFPVVIVPYCNWRLYKISDSWVEVRNEKVQLPVTVVSLSKKASESGFTKELEEEEKEQLLDNLNLLYVAFTRPVERLHILSLASTGNKMPSVDGWLAQFTALAGTSGAPYQLGNREKRRSKPHIGKTEQYPLLPLTFDNGGVVKIKSSFSRGGTDDNAIEQGQMLHLLLSMLRTESDLDKALRQMESDGYITKADLPELTKKIHKITRHNELKDYFTDGLQLKLEQELITALGTVLRPDRVVLKDDSAVIIDYKTGKEDSKNYSRQLIEYENALRDMGYKKFRKLLVYTEEPMVVEII